MVRTSAALAALALVTLPLRAADWPQFRGPARHGVTDVAGLATEWAEGQPAVVWRQPLGGGFSGIAVAGGRLYTMDSDGETEAVVCLDAASGATRWRTPVGKPDPELFPEPGPRTTPTVAGDTLYAASSDARLVALDAETGEKRWEQDLSQWGPAPRFGYAVSPLVDGEVVIVEVGAREKSPGVIAFDRATGEERWSALDGPAGYSSPIAVEIGGVKQYVFSRFVEVVGLSTAGELLWRHPTDPRTAIPMPIFLPPDRVFVAAPEDSFGGRVLRVSRGEDGTFAVEEVWNERLMRNHFNTSVLVDGHLYGFDNATFRCLDAATGERKWAHRGFGKGSLLAAGDLLYVLGDSGEVALVAATAEEYRELGRVQATAGGRAWTSPSLAGGRLYVRDGDEIVCLDVGQPGGKGEEVSP